MIQDVDRNLAESFGLKRPHGALLSQVLPDGPAAKSGLQAGDIITRFNGREIKFSSDLPIAVGRAPVGKKVDVVLMRRGKEDTISVMVGELPNEKTGSVRSSVRTDNRLGVSV
ncbi:PDZ domain-containing protein, partial [Sinorhizobium meliloti]|uniref:PDZ domain-containing protein n=1 Tax=Rhizobium meliloti TaxID=382 RepID=UPI001F3E96DC